MYKSLGFCPRAEERRARDTESTVCQGRTREEGVGFEGIGSNSMACFGVRAWARVFRAGWTERVKECRLELGGTA